MAFAACLSSQLQRFTFNPHVSGWNGILQLELKIKVFCWIMSFHAEIFPLKRSMKKSLGDLVIILEAGEVWPIQ